MQLDKEGLPARRQRVRGDPPGRALWWKSLLQRSTRSLFLFLTSEGRGKELRHHCRQRCAHRGERGKRLMPSFAATVARSLWLYVSEEPPRCLLEPHEFHIEAPWATHERKERKKKRPTLSRSRRPSLVALSLCFFFFFTLLPIKNKLDETRSKNLRGGKNGDLLCFSNKITSHESSAPYLLEKKKKALLKSHAGRKKKREEEIQVLKYAISLVLLFSSPLSLNRTHSCRILHTCDENTHSHKRKRKKKGE